MEQKREIKDKNTKIGNKAQWSKMKDMWRYQDICMFIFRSVGLSNG